MPNEALSRPIPGVHFVQPGDREHAGLRHWIAREVDDSGLPPLYMAENALTSHVDRAVKRMCEYMTTIEHKTLDGRPFRGVCYIAADDSISVYTRLLPRHDTVVIVVGASWLFQLVKIAHSLEAALNSRPRVRSATSPPGGVVEPPDVSALLEGSESVTEGEAAEIADGWPSPEYIYTEPELGSWTVFYDLVRLIWCHELAHGLVGHTAFDREHLRLSVLNESSSTRKGVSVIDAIGGTRTQILQCQELHADEFSVRFNVLQILYGHDPAGLFVESRLDLTDRLLHLNTAFCIFAIGWALEEDPSRELPWGEATHPPVALRFDRFRGFVLDLAAAYDTELAVSVNVLTFSFLEVLAKSSRHFLELQIIGPLVVRTPTTKALLRYEETLMRLARAMEEAIRGYVFFPTKEA